MRIRALPGGTHVKIAALTASIFQSDAHAPALFDATLHKPFSVHGVFDCMQQLLLVQFERHAPVSRTAPDNNAVLESIKTLPDGLKIELLHAIQTLSQETVFAAIERVRVCDTNLADAFMHMAKLYEYERMGHMLGHTFVATAPQER